MQILLADYGRASHYCKDPEILGRHYGPAKAACSNCQMFATLHEASALFRHKWSMIERMARESIKTGVIDNGVITLVMP
jgi:hypothetical protein